MLTVVSEFNGEKIMLPTKMCSSFKFLFEEPKLKNFCYCSRTHVILNYCQLVYFTCLWYLLLQFEY